jgi:hypothetical protein
MAKKHKLRGSSKKKGGVVIKYATKSTNTTPLVKWSLFLLIVSFVSSCGNGWTIGGLEVSPSDSVEVNYLIITDQDSVQHYYKPSIGDGILVGDNYCYKHSIWEDVRKTSE